jgi:enoyl-[acyl-carrier protein] reductase II
MALMSMGKCNDPLSLGPGLRFSVERGVTMGKKTLQDLFGIKHPMVQAGMVYVSGAPLAAAAAEAGVLGLIGLGGMTPERVAQEIQTARKLTQKPFGVNIPLLYSRVQEQIDAALSGGVRIFFTSAGSPKTWTSYLKERGCTVVHVTSTPELAQKCEAAGVDAVVAEGFEAGGHNGRDELTTMVLIPMVVDAVKIPVIAAGGIANGRQMAAAMALGAQGVQVGTRFAATQESTAHHKAMVSAPTNGTSLMLKKLVPVRLLKNPFAEKVAQLESQGASSQELAELLGKGRAYRGMFEGDLIEGELEVGQVVGMIKDLPTVKDLVSRFMDEYSQATQVFKGV